jgi:PAS domain S-box-containing protein
MLATEPIPAPTARDLGVGSVFEHVQEPLLVIEVDSARVVLWNSAAEALLATSLGNAPSLSVETLVPERFRADLQRRMSQYARGKRARIVEASKPIPTTATRHDGQEIALEVRLSRITHTLRVGCFVLAMIRDVSQAGPLRRQAEKRFRELEALYQADERLYRSLRLEDVLQALVDIAANLLHADKTSVLIWDSAREHLAVQAAYGFLPETVTRTSYSPAEGISKWVAATGQSIAVEDVRTDTRIPPTIAAIDEAEGIRSLISTPIMLAGDVFGVFNVNSTRPRRFSLDEQRLLFGLAQRAAMAIENARLFAQSEQRRREIEALYQADALLYRSLQLDDVLSAIIEVVIDVLRADKAQVLVWDDKHARLIVGAQRGYSPETVARLAFRPGEGIAGRVAATGQTVMVEDAATDPRTDKRINSITANEGVRSYICVPIILKGSIFGVFSVVYCEPRTFSDEDRRALEALAQRVAVAVQNAELHERMQSAAALEERQRLARELHDAVTQTLFSASLIAEVLPRLWGRDPAQGRARLEELRRLNRGALAEMRTLLLELRPLALTETPIDSLLRQLVEASMSHVATTMDFIVEGTPRTLNSDVKVALYRLTQEALNNVVRHSQARHAEVRLQWTPERVTVRISDDGKGFDQAAVPGGHLGIGFMRERAAAVRASVQLASKPGLGTTVTIVWPA